MVFPKLCVAARTTISLTTLHTALRKMDKATIREKVRHILSLVGLEGMEERMTNQLSGGQQQRVVLARAFWSLSRVSSFFDEPLSNLDANRR